MSTKEKLAQALRNAQAPDEMVRKAEQGFYDDFESPLALPIHQLVNDAMAHSLTGIAQSAMAGEFDSTLEESTAWFEREGKHLL